MLAFARPIFRFLRKRRFLAIWFCGALTVAAFIVAGVFAATARSIV